MEDVSFPRQVDLQALCWVVHYDGVKPASSETNTPVATLNSRLDRLREQFQRRSLAGLLEFAMAKGLVQVENGALVPAPSHADRN